MIIIKIFTNTTTRCCIWGIIGGYIAYYAEKRKSIIGKNIADMMPIFFFFVEVIINLVF